MGLPIRMVAIDLDGTLLDNRKRMSEENVAALEELRAAGICLVICTGRHPGNARHVLGRYGLVLPVIGLNGSLLFDEDGAVIAAHPIDRAAADAVAGLMEKNGMDYLAFNRDHAILREQVEGTFTRGPYLGYLYEISNGNYKAGVAEMEKALKGDVYKVAAFNREFPVLLEKTRSELAGCRHLEITRSSESNIEIMPEGVDKGAGLREYARLRNTPMAEIMSLGDQENDLPMLRSTGYSVAMGNACESVKQAATHRTASNEEDGVAKALQAYVLA
jgi:Cof subfamily protein (haloacid dehalogenase superfamily)